MGNIKALYDDEGNFIDFVEEADEIDAMLEPDKDPYWQSPIPKSERKHKRDKVEESTAMKRFKLCLAIGAPIAIILLLYYTVVDLI